MVTTTDLARVLAVELPVMPRLPTWAFAVDLGDGRIQLRSPRSVLTIRRPDLTSVYGRLRDQLDGSHTLGELYRLAGEDERIVAFLLKILRAHGFLQEAAAPPTLEADEIRRFEGQLRVLGQLDPEPLSVLAQLRAARVLLAGDDELVGLLSESLSGCGMAPRHTAVVCDCDLLIGCFLGADLAVAKTLNAACVSGGTRFLPLFVEGATASLGPTVVPHETACLQCLEARRRSAQPDPDAWTRYRRRQEELTERDTGLLAPLAAIVVSQAALEAVRLLTSIAPPTTVGTLFDFDLESPMPAARTVLKVPRCAVCARRLPVQQPWDADLDPPGPR